MTALRSVLVVEDEEMLARNVKHYLERHGLAVDTAGSVRSALASLSTRRPGLVLLDHHLPDGSGLDILRVIRVDDSETRIVMVTAHGSVAAAVEAMKAGADDYLTKPVSLEELLLVVQRLLAQRQMQASLAYYRRQEEERSGRDRILGQSPPIQALKQRIGQLLAMEARSSGTPPPVLIAGDTGTGKELVARAIHFDGPRRDGPFIEINCAALPSHLVESELFGHEKGAFTDAKERRSGLIPAADGGTLFLDEIGELPMATQAKLLKVLEDRSVRPVGGVRDRTVDVRFVAATNAALEDRVRSGEFRSDLYFRLATLTINPPPLSERGEDVVLLAEHFLEELRRRYGREPMVLDSCARTALLAHGWPGNVRELRNVIEQAVLFTVGTQVRATDLNLREPAALADRAVAVAAGTSLPDMERDLIEQTLTRLRGNVTLAARELGISRDTLRYRMEKHGFRREDFTGA